MGTEPSLEFFVEFKVVQHVEMGPSFRSCVALSPSAPR